MSNLNDVKLQGRLVKDAIFKIAKNGKKIALFTIAVNRSRKNENGEYSDYVSYFSTSTFSKSEKFDSYLKKGQSVIIEGYLQQKRKDITTDDGHTIFDSRIYICTTKVHLLFDRKNQESQESLSAPATEDSFAEEDLIDDYADDICLEEESEVIF